MSRDAFHVPGMMLAFGKMTFEAEFRVEHHPVAGWTKDTGCDWWVPLILDGCHLRPAEDVWEIFMVYRVGEQPDLEQLKECARQHMQERAEEKRIRDEFKQPR
jgi:hypothetical protein